MWRFLAACWSLSGASSDRFERAGEVSIPFLGTPFPLQWSQFGFAGHQLDVLDRIASGAVDEAVGDECARGG
jgi:hypothetical protein